MELGVEGAMMAFKEEDSVTGTLSRNPCLWRTHFWFLPAS